MEKFTAGSQMTISQIFDFQKFRSEVITEQNTETFKDLRHTAIYNFCQWTQFILTKGKRNQSLIIHQLLKNLAMISAMLWLKTLEKTC